MGKVMTAGCGMEIRECENWVCPYYSRPEEWQKEHRGYSPCGVDLAVDNSCVYGIIDGTND